MNLKTIDIQGKPYVPVHERIRYFNETHEKGSIKTEISYEGDAVRCKATVWPDASDQNRFFNGHGEELRSDGYINKTSSTENCESSAVGRALGMMGIGIETSVASADEMQGAIQKATKAPTSPAEPFKDDEPAYVPNETPALPEKHCAACGKWMKPESKFLKCYQCNLSSKNKAV